jgi:hypothetical protein
LPLWNSNGKSFRKAIEETVEDFDPKLPELPEPEAQESDGWLFDSRREYVDQLLYYKSPSEREKMMATQRSRQGACEECGEEFMAKRGGARYCSERCQQRAAQRRAYHRRKAGV